MKSTIVALLSLLLIMFLAGTVLLAVSGEFFPWADFLVCLIGVGVFASAIIATFDFYADRPRAYFWVAVIIVLFSSTFLYSIYKALEFVAINGALELTIEQEKSLVWGEVSEGFYDQFGVLGLIGVNLTFASMCLYWAYCHYLHYKNNVKPSQTEKEELW